MKISYSWLKEYIDIDINPSELSSILTDTGLEVGGVEEIQSIKGGLEGLVIGEVKTCKPHPDSDHLSLTTVDLGDGNEPYQIVCGAPNVDAGQRVVVATVGTILYDGDKEFKIKKSKIRGQVSLGMICAEDEIGLGDSHDGIMVLGNDAVPGTPAKEYFKIESDTVFEIDLTPNRVDGASHIGVARDIAAYLGQTQEIGYKKPDISKFKVDNNSRNIDIKIENNEACPRYSGITVSGITVKKSPDWLQNRLKSIGLTPINNVVDITNFVLHELGQPLHAFDADKIKGGKVIVKTLEKDTPFITLDEEERKLDANDLMICNEQEGMCIAGVFGGIKSGVTEQTTSVFLESAYFNPVYVRKTARRHALSTDASFRFERGVDPNMTIFALKRAALLIKEIAGGEISSDIIDIYPKPISGFEVTIRFSQIKRLIGEYIDRERVLRILKGLEIEVKKDNGDSLELLVPPYRVDVQREADVIEEILRIYGYNTVEIHNEVNSTLAYVSKPDINFIKELIANQLASNGFNEMMANSLTKKEYYEERKALSSDETVIVYNPLSRDLSAMRQTLLFGALEAVAFNRNRQNPDIKFFEFGNVYKIHSKIKSDNPIDKYIQNEKLSVTISGNRNPESWISKSEQVSFYYIKAVIENVLTRVGIDLGRVKQTSYNNELFSDGLLYNYNNAEIGYIVAVSSKTLKEFDIKQNVYYAEFDWGKIMKAIKKHKVEFTELPKYPEVRRDLSLLIDNSITFNELKEQAFKAEKKILRDVTLFDVYEGENLGEGKKSYALSFILRDDSKTLNDKYIDKVMKNIMRNLEQNCGATIR